MTETIEQKAEDLPMLTKEEVVKLGTAANKRAAMPRFQVMQFIHIIMMENARLLKEVNMFREDRGLPLRTIYDPITGKPMGGK